MLLLSFALRRVDAGVDRREISSALFLGEAGERCARPHGCLEVDHGRERVVVHDDRFGAVNGGCLGLRDHDRDRLPGKHDFLPGERLGRAVVAVARERQICGAEDGEDARQRQRLLGVDASDERVRLGREDEACVEQPVHVAVRGVAGRARHLLGRVHAWA